MPVGGPGRPGPQASKAALQPLDVVAVDGQHVEAAGRQRGKAQQVVLRRQHQAALLGRGDAGRGTAVAGAAALAHFDEDQRAVTLAHHEVDLAAARRRAACDPIIALFQHQPARLQPRRRARLGGHRRVQPGAPCRHAPPPAAVLHANFVTTDPAPLLHAARLATGHQQHPAGTLYVVATPIGNLADITLRAIHVLSLVDAVACEDTRVAAQLLTHLGLHKPLRALHAHNEHEAAQGVLALLAMGQRVAYVSDAGTPAVSDPGAVLVAAARAAGHAVVPLPGPSSALAALSAAGDTHGRGLLLHRLPARQGR